MDPFKLSITTVKNEERCAYSRWDCHWAKTLQNENPALPLLFRVQADLVGWLLTTHSQKPKESCRCQQRWPAGKQPTKTGPLALRHNMLISAKPLFNNPSWKHMWMTSLRMEFSLKFIMGFVGHCHKPTLDPPEPPQSQQWALSVTWRRGCGRVAPGEHYHLPPLFFTEMLFSLTVQKNFVCRTEGNNLSI